MEHVMQNHLKSVLKTFLLSCLMTIAIPTLAGEPSQSLININNASVEQLSELKGIGKAKAEAIVAYREAHGKFSSFEELTAVKGIGAATIEKNKALLALE
jgi:competence protein ComEA|tara:strand:- start:599 stop:898 length:300 start_codon:yes stop_codon:yes gene_type:complete